MTRLKRLIEDAKYMLSAFSEFDHDCHLSPDSGCTFCERIINIDMNILMLEREMGLIPKPKPKDTREALEGLNSQLDIVKHQAQAMDVIFQALEKAVKRA